MKKYIDLIQRDLLTERSGGTTLLEEGVSPVDLVTVYALIPIYKESNEANSIQVARVKNSKGEELQYDIIVGKGLWNIGDKGIYVQPDYCLPFTKHFLEYTQPNGDPAKSKLGKKNRVKAIKFNFAFKNDDGPIYSNGVLLPMNKELEVLIKSSKNLMEDLQVTKYISEDGLDSSQKKEDDEDFPSFLYHTDEPTCLHEDTLIQTEDGLMTIKEICEKKYVGKVLSYDLESETNEYQNIIDHTISSSNNDWYEIELEDGTIIKATGNHYFFLPELNCFRKVSDLVQGDVFLIKD